MGEIDVLSKLAGELVLDEAEFREALVSRKYRVIHQNEVRHAYEEAQITAVPTFVIGDERITGAACREVFEKTINQELNKENRSKFNSLH